MYGDDKRNRTIGIVGSRAALAAAAAASMAAMMAVDYGRAPGVVLRNVPPTPDARLEKKDARQRRRWLQRQARKKNRR